MGSDAELYLFDIDSFQNHIVPGFHKLLMGQAPPRWLIHLIKHSDFRGTRGLVEEFKSHPVYMKEYCSYLSSDLGCIDPGRFNPDLGNKPRKVWLLQYDYPMARRCAEKNCLANQHCPFYLNNSKDVAELLNYLFGEAVAWLCEGPGVFMGRSTAPSTYGEALNELGVPKEALLRELLDSLGIRGFIFGYHWANGDGVHGWLNNQECHELAGQLWRLDLPDYSATPENLERWQPLNQRNSEHDWDKLVLAYIRAMAEDAAKKKLGLVWMNDVPMDTREQYGSFQEWLQAH